MFDPREAQNPLNLKLPIFWDDVLPDSIRKFLWAVSHPLKELPYTQIFIKNKQQSKQTTKMPYE